MKPYKILQWGSKRSVVKYEEIQWESNRSVLKYEQTIYLLDNDYLMNLDEMGLVQ